MNQLIGIIQGFALALIVANVLIVMQVIDCRLHREPIPAPYRSIEDHPLFVPCDGIPPPPTPDLEGTH